MKGGWLSATIKSAFDNSFILNMLGLSASPVESGTVLLNVQISVQLNHGFV